nr:hypothetical protein [Thermococcus sp.]
MPGLPPIRRPPQPSEPPSEEGAEKAIELVKKAIPFFRPGKPIRRPDGIDVPILYLDFAIDRMHFNPLSGTPLPKGFPGHFWESECSSAEEKTREVLKGLKVIDACEFREPEDCWVVPLAWKSFIVIHVRVSRDGKELVPDYGLTEEVRRHGL